MEPVTVKEMIRYCEAFIADIQKQIAKGEGEPWMSEAIRIESAIVAHLRKTPEPVRAEAFNEDYVGELIKQRVLLEREVNELTARCELTAPRMVEQHFIDKLTKRKEELTWTLATLRETKQRHKLHLQQRLAGVQSELDSGLVELADEQELRHLQQQLVRKIEIIDTELKTI